MRWIKGDTPRHIDKNSQQESRDTYIVYLTDNKGTLNDEGKAYPITKGVGYVIERDTMHWTESTDNEPKLMIGPMTKEGDSAGPDKATLDLLVKKGLITAEERAKALEEASAARKAAGLDKIFVKEDAVKGLTYSGRIQTRFETNDFTTSPLYYGVRAEMGGGISAEIVNNFADNSIDKAVLTLEKPGGTLNLGYQKVQWGLEENTSSSKLLTVERSANNLYWNEAGASSNGRLGFGALHTGLHYSNKYDVDSAQTFEVGAALVNSNQGSSLQNNDLGTFANVLYTYKISDTKNYNIGLNWGRSTTYYDNTISGFNPYIKSQFDKLILEGELMQTTTSGKTPKGYNALAAYKFTDQVEAVVRYSQLDTDKGGAAFNSLFSNSGSSDVYNKFNSVYVGVNYYFVDHNASIMVGYEKAQASDIVTGGTITSGKADADIFRLQVQVLF
jgi:hypothetical protein